MNKGDSVGRSRSEWHPEFSLEPFNLRCLLVFQVTGLSSKRNNRSRNFEARAGQEQGGFQHTNVARASERAWLSPGAQIRPEKKERKRRLKSC